MHEYVIIYPPWPLTGLGDAGVSRYIRGSVRGGYGSALTEQIVHQHYPAIGGGRLG